MKALSLITAARLDNHDGGYIPGIRSYFKLMDLHAGHYWSTVDYMRWIDIHQSAFHERLKQRDERPAMTECTTPPGAARSVPTQRLRRQLSMPGISRM